MFHIDAPMLKYCQKLLNSCSFSSLESAFDSIKQTKAFNAILFRTEESFKSKLGNRIYFANAILKNKIKLKGKPRVYYSLRKYKNMGSYDILAGISEHFTLVQLMDYLGNVNHAISVVGWWIFDSNYERSLVLDIELLDIICALSVGK